MKYLVSMLSLVLFTASINADISYDYFEIGYEHINVDGLRTTNDTVELNFNEVDATGLVLEGSYSLGENYFIYADFDFTSYDLDSDVVDFLNDITNDIINEPAVKVDTQVVGLGFHTSGDTQFVAKVGILRQEIDSNFIKEGVFGYDVELGGRGLLGNNFEWEANLSYFDPDLNKGDQGDFGFNTSLRYHFNDKFSTDFSTSIKDNETAFGVNVRYNFSR